MNRVSSRTAFAIVLLVIASCTFAAAQNITGSVTNGTTGKPSAGDEVTLLSLSQGMQEVGSTKTNAQGKFSMAQDTGGRRSEQGLGRLEQRPEQGAGEAAPQRLARHPARRHRRTGLKERRPCTIACSDSMAQAGSGAR